MTALFFRGFGRRDLRETGRSQTRVLILFGHTFLLHGTGLDD